jgi:hypothetical protein
VRTGIRFEFENKEGGREGYTPSIRLTVCIENAAVGYVEYLSISFGWDRLTGFDTDGRSHHT